MMDLVISCSRRVRVEKIIKSSMDGSKTIDRMEENSNLSVRCMKREIDEYAEIIKVGIILVGMGKILEKRLRMK